MLKWVNVIMLKYSKSQKKKLLRKWSVTQSFTEEHRVVQKFSVYQT